MSDERFGKCIVFLPTPGIINRFYGPFENEDAAREWITEQEKNGARSMGIIPLRRTDIERSHDDFYTPLKDADMGDFWDE